MSSSEEKDTANIPEDAEEASDDFKKPEVNPLLAEEAKLKAKYPNVGRPMAGHSAFLQKRLQKGQKYFDSGDYQMAKQRGPLSKMRGGAQLRVTPPTGETIPTPESLPARKTSLVQNSKTPLT
ncbi:cAMP-regulated phosphoprotein 19-like [Pollicipes pollicipes]|uniref:cAMP-regulated phosphoprotein 19-like n=1 Tax=Pollicipes pollicipes TaxID=41117 RepID=UPI001884CC47|nr:cAMP-regulated phosphoprotein 19-like [Pollicipes pollicipes]XP_037081112.1 cAMP-regulated phosphoprotein 19-like [Pollicipes pollicipes]